jgi:hypothetical protein
MLRWQHDLVLITLLYLKKVTVISPDGTLVAVAGTKDVSDMYRVPSMTELKVRLAFSACIPIPPADFISDTRLSGRDL